MKFVNKNYYEILDISPSASEEEVKRAYRTVRGTFTPDSVAIYSLYTPDESEAIAHKIEEAFQILSTPERRASYDRYLQHVVKVPARGTGPEAFWDAIHGLEATPDMHEPLDDVTELLADTTVEGEEAVEEVRLEASGGDARAVERPFTDDRVQGLEPDAIPDPTPGARANNRPPVLAHHSAVPQPPRSPGQPMSRGPVPPATTRPTPSRDAWPTAPAAPAAPPVKGAPTWTPPAADSSPVPGTSSPRPAPSQTRTTPTPPPPVPKTVTPASGTRLSSLVTDPSPPTAGGWSRSYARAVAPTRPLPDRPISPQMLAEAEAEHGLSGLFLRLVREYKGISLNDIAERTKIQTTYLRFMEEERYADLPAPVYVEGFVSQVARLLKLDVDRVVQGYMARYEGNQRPGPSNPDLEDDR